MAIIKKIIILHKKEGQTPLDALEIFKKKNSEYQKVPMTYAGRLDPMASGVLVVLAGEKIKDKETFLAMDKEYDFSVLFGFGTDTYDILGKVLACEVNEKIHRLAAQDFVLEIQKNLPYFKGKLKQEYPMYSSKTVNGKPLFWYARNAQEVKIPSRNIVIKKLVLKKVKKITSQKLFLQIEKRINKVAGDFRQKEIVKIWKQTLLSKKVRESFYVVDFAVQCSSGTYVRQIANSLGEKISIPALAFSIKRTRVGKFT